MFVVSPDSIASAPCRSELAFAAEQRKRILPVVYRDPGSPENDLPPSLALPQWTFLRASDDFIAGVQVLVEAINTDFDLMPEHRRLLQTAEIWQRNSCSSSYLLRKDGLKKAEEWLARSAQRADRLPRPTSLQIEYIHASQHSSTRTTRIGFAVASVVAIVMGVLAMIAFVQKSRADQRRAEAERLAKIAISRQLATTALLNKDTHPDLASLLSLEAGAFADTFEARSAPFSVLQSNTQLHTFLHHPSPVYDVVFSGNGKWLASATESEIRLWDLATYRPMGLPLEIRTGRVKSMAFVGDSMLQISGDRVLETWDVVTRERLAGPHATTTDIPIEELLAHVGIDVRENHIAALSPNSKFAAFGVSSGVELFSLASRRALGPPLQGHRAPVTSLSFSPDGRLLASASWDSIRLWEVPSCKPFGQSLQGHQGPVEKVTFSPTGDLLASASADGTVRLWKVGHGPALGTPLQHTSYISSIAYNADGSLLAAAGWDGVIHLWNVKERRPFGNPLRGHTEEVNSVAFSPDGRLLVSASGKIVGGKDFTVRVWDVAAQQPAGAPLQGHADAVTSVAFSPDGKLVASASWDKTVRLWDVARRELSGRPLECAEPVERVAFSPNGTLLAAATHERIQLWDLTRREHPGRPLNYTTWVESVAFSPNGKLLASAAWDNTVRLWDMSNGQQVGISMPCEMPACRTVAFSPDGKLLAADWGGTVQLWDVATTQAFGGALEGHTDLVVSVAFSPDGKLLASAGDHTVWLWELSRDSWAKRLCRLANRNLSFAEWQQYVGKEYLYHQTCADLPPGGGCPNGVSQVKASQGLRP